MAPSQVISNTVLQKELFDPKTGRLNWDGLQLFLQWQKMLSAGFDNGGNLKSNLLPSIGIVGRGGTIGSILQLIADNGVVLASGLPAATPIAQGAVFLWAGATSNHLGTAAGQPSTAFDPAGAAATAQSNAEAHADAVAATAQSNAEAYADTAIATAFAPGLSITIVTAPLTVGGTQGSMTFTHGLLTGQVAAT